MEIPETLGRTLGASMDDSRIDLSRLDRYVESRRDEFEEKLAQLVEIPTVSMDPERKDDMSRGATLAGQFIEHVGGRAQILKTRGHGRTSRSCSANRTAATRVAGRRTTRVQR
jgi:hypothetical protein